MHLVINVICCFLKPYIALITNDLVTGYSAVLVPLDRLFFQKTKRLRSYFDVHRNC